MSLRRVDQIEKSWRPRKTIKEIIRLDLEVNELDPNMVYERTT